MTTLYDLVRAAASAYPAHVAVEMDGLSVTYADLVAQATALGTQLRARHPDSGAQPRIALFATRDMGTYVGYLAALHAGAAVVPVSPAAPAARVAAIASAARVTAMLAAQPVPTSIAEALDTAGVPVTMINLPAPVDLPAPASPPSATAPHRGDADELAYVLFTSGSTGRPKGVPITHRSVCAYIAYATRRYEVTPHSRLSHTFELVFDPSMFDLFGAWTCGATLVVPAERELMTPGAYVNEHRITHWYSVPSVISIANRVGTLSPGLMPDLRWSRFVGERLTLEQAHVWRAAAPASTIDNVYGPTELTVTCAEFRLPQDPAGWPVTSNGTVPIGTIYEHLEAVVLDERGQPAADGELCVRGVQRFDGYVDPHDNVDRFLSLRTHGAELYDGSTPVTRDHWYRTGDRVRIEHGQLVHLGRLDRQVKVNGVRMELGEIEAAVRSHPRVHDAVAVVVDCVGGLGVVRAVVAGPGASNQDIIAHVGKLLPSSMVPRHYRWVPALPLGGNGKIDYSQVYRLATEEPQHRELTRA